MEELFLFLIKSIMVSGVLYVWYLLALKNKKLHNYNRFFLLFTLYASIQVPLLHIEWSPMQAAPMAIFPAPKLLLHKLEGASTAVQGIKQIPFSNLDWKTITILAITLISIGLLIMMLTRIVLILRIGKQYRRTVVDGIVIVHTDIPKAPFSFMGKVYWRKDLSVDTACGRLILQHEFAHIRQWHTYDKLASQLLTRIFWINPFYWLIQKELGIVHEFIADEKAIVNNNEGIEEGEYTDAFARMLLRVHNPTSYFEPHHQFFASPVKRRLIMLQTRNKVRASMLRRVAVLPIIACSVLALGMRPAAPSPDTKTRSNQKIVLVIDPGHGGDDKGGHYGSLMEKDLTLKVAERIQKLASTYNVEVHLTRNADKFLSLQERAAFSNNIHPDFFICLHVDELPGKGAFDIAINGKNEKTPESERLALSIYKYVARPEWGQQKAPSEKGMAYVLKENNCPSVLIEMGNIRDKEQMQHILDDAKLNELSSRILEGVVEAHQQ